MGDLNERRPGAHSTPTGDDGVGIRHENTVSKWFEIGDNTHMLI